MNVVVKLAAGTGRRGDRQSAVRFKQSTGP